jgi:hypothetical protein
MCLIFHRVLASFVALIALLAVIISPIVVGLYADVRNWNDSTDGNMRWCHDDAKMRDAPANLGLAAGTTPSHAIGVAHFRIRHHGQWAPWALARFACILTPTAFVSNQVASRSWLVSCSFPSSSLRSSGLSSRAAVPTW